MFPADSFCGSSGMTDAEFLTLWQNRYVRADGSPRAHFGTVLTALTQIRKGKTVELFKRDRRK